MQEEMFRKKLKVVDLLKQHPEQIEPALTWVSDRIWGFSRKQDTRDAVAWPSTYMVCGKLPKYWRGEYLVDNLKRMGLSSELVAAIDQRDSEDVARVFDFLHGISWQRKLPRCCLGKGICQEVFVARMKAIGRQEEFMRMFLEEKKVDWARCGAFQLKRGSDGKILLTHCDGAQVAWPAYFNIDGVDTKIDSSWHEQITKVVLPGDEVPLARKFADNVGPNTSQLVNKEGKFFIQFALPIAERVAAQRSCGVQRPDEMQVVEAMVSNEQTRKRDAVKMAMAARPPKRQRRQVGSCIL